VDLSNPLQELVSEIEEKCHNNHWKGAVRKLKKLTRRLRQSDPEQYYAMVTESLLVNVLTVCSANRLQGARASEPARKIMEQLVEMGYIIPTELGNHCIQNTLDDSTVNSRHQGFGGVDTALAMVAAMQQSGAAIPAETYDKLILALGREEGVSSMEAALALLRQQVVERSVTPPLSTFKVLAQSALSATTNTTKATAQNASSVSSPPADPVFTILAYTKAAGYDLDTIASLEDGRALLAAGVIAAERVQNDALGFRLLKAASQAPAAPDRGDTLVALSSSAAQRACTLIHKRAINKAVVDGEWQLAVKVLELMVQRFLKPSPWVWRNVVTCCAKAEKSKKATALLLDWVKLYEQGKAEKPPLSVFNTCVNVCEICNEQDLTLVVLDAMKKTHETDGNLITFNIALKRLAKMGNYHGCEGIIVGMLQADVEPSVVSYTTAIASCVSSEVRQPAIAYEWLRRMRTRNVPPNVITYNTVLAACVDGTMAGSYLASKIAKEMLVDVDQQLLQGDADNEFDQYRNVIPDAATKVVARKLMEQLKQNWIDGQIAKAVATETIRVPLLQLVDFQKSEAAERARQQEAKRRAMFEDEGSATTRRMEIELESLAHRVAEV
jgi:PPR repeat family